VQPTARLVTVRRPETAVLAHRALSRPAPRAARLLALLRASSPAQSIPVRSPALLADASVVQPGGIAGASRTGRGRGHRQSRQLIARSVRWRERDMPRKHPGSPARVLGCRRTVTSPLRGASSAGLRASPGTSRYGPFGRVGGSSEFEPTGFTAPVVLASTTRMVAAALASRRCGRFGSIAGSGAGRSRGIGCSPRTG